MHITLIGGTTEHIAEVNRFVQEIWGHEHNAISIPPERADLIAAPPVWTDVFLVVGGDGTMLRSAKLNTETPFLGYNTGHRGFLMNAGRSIPEILQEYHDEVILPRLAPVIRANIECVDGGRSCCHSLNDIAVERASGQALKLRVWIDGEPLGDGPITCSGINVTTPIGSTAYHRSITGTSIAIGVPVMGLSFISAQVISKAIFVDLSSSIDVEVTDNEKRPALICHDGDHLDSRPRRITIYHGGTCTHIGMPSPSVLLSRVWGK